MDFTAPKGIRLFSTFDTDSNWLPPLHQRFNAPKGIRLFSTAPTPIKIKHLLNFL
jgi:hypothetical protein